MDVDLALCVSGEYAPPPPLVWCTTFAWAVRVAAECETASRSQLKSSQQRSSARHCTSAAAAPAGATDGGGGTNDGGTNERATTTRPTTPFTTHAYTDTSVTHTRQVTQAVTAHGVDARRGVHVVTREGRLLRFRSVHGD